MQLTPKHSSLPQLDEQPSPSMTLPSSHCSGGFRTPLPHTLHPVDGEQVPVPVSQVPALEQPIATAQVTGLPPVQLAA